MADPANAPTRKRAREAVGMPTLDLEPDRHTRYTALAEQLLGADNPTMAIAHELGDQAGRIDAALRRIGSLEARLSYVTDKEVARGDL